MLEKVLEGGHEKARKRENRLYRNVGNGNRSYQNVARVTFTDTPPVTYLKKVTKNCKSHYKPGKKKLKYSYTCKRKD